MRGTEETEGSMGAVESSEAGDGCSGGTSDGKREPPSSSEGRPLKSAKTMEEGVRVDAEYELEHGGRLACSVGSVVDFTGAAIVNAANSRCLGGGGVDGAVTAAGGASLAEARRQLPVMDDDGTRCLVGRAVATEGGELKARWCIHAVGPNYNRLADDDDGDDLLASAYADAMKRASELEATTLAFSLLSSGIFRGPKTLRHVLAIAVDAVARHSYRGLDKVHLVAFTNSERDNLLDVAAAYFLPSPPGDPSPPPSAARPPEDALPPRRCASDLTDVPPASSAAAAAAEDRPTQPTPSEEDDLLGEPVAPVSSNE